MEEYSYTSTHPLGHTGPVTGTLYHFLREIYYILLQSLRRPSSELTDYPERGSVSFFRNADVNFLD